MTYPKIFLPQLHTIEQPAEYKLHFGRLNPDGVQPLDEWVLDHENWIGWQKYKPGRDEFSRRYIFSLMSFYHERDIWLFGGIFEVIARHAHEYDVRLTEQASSFIGRLKLLYPYKDRATRPNFEKHYEKLEVSELLREPYSGRIFPGYDEVDLSFVELEAIIKNDRPDWKQALELAKGIYLITDILTQKRYVGAAYGEAGIWSRWTNYVQTGHGGNIELRAVAADANLEYCRANFRFAILEHHMARVSDETVIAREVFWKGVLLSRGDSGLNRN